LHKKICPESTEQISQTAALVPSKTGTPLIFLQRKETFKALQDNTAN
jgi:hypothetical protein